MRAFIDRIESGMATLLLGEDESIRLVVPVAVLPSGASEGATLTLNFALDKESGEKGRKEVQSLLDSLQDD